MAKSKSTSKLTLKPSWELTTEHAASSYGQPVLVNRGSGEAYGPGDILRPYTSWGYITAAAAVERMTSIRNLTDDERIFVERFVNLGH
jgi:hypothetical protein